MKTAPFQNHAKLYPQHACVLQTCCDYSVAELVVGWVEGYQQTAQSTAYGIYGHTTPCNKSDVTELSSDFVADFT